MFFSQTFFDVLILTALFMMAVGAVALVVMLFKDIKTKTLW